MPVKQVTPNSNKKSLDELIKENNYSEKEVAEFIARSTKREEAAISEYKRAQVDRLKELRAQEIRASELYDRKLAKFKKANKSDSTYEQQKAQLDETERILKGISAKRSALAQELTDLGQDNLVAMADAESLEEHTVKMLNQKKSELDQARINLKQAQASGNADRINAAKAEVEQREQAYRQAASDNSMPMSESETRAQNIQAISAGTGALPGIFQHGIGAAMSKEHESASGAAIEGLSSKLSGFVSKFGPVGKVVGGVISGLGKTTSKILDVAMAIRSDIAKLVDSAASTLSDNVGRINAAIEGTGQTYKSTYEDAVESLGLNKFVQQTAYLSEITQLTTRGITYNVEQRALLETIKDKTLGTFNAMNENLLRLVRLTQTDITSSEFGLETALRNTLNKVFKDSTYMQGMYDNIASAISDAIMISGRKDVIEYSSVIQTWMGAMYESGINGNTVSKIASALNALGSGNVSALASDQDMQRLILLSMDTIGMDFADILQQGLSSSDITDLLTAVVKYLTKIESNTKDNNVLTSSYTQLFGMSMADLQGFKNLNEKMGSLSYVNQSSALSTMQHELALFQSTQRNIMAEQIDNVIKNSQYAAGAQIANDSSKYMSWKVANLALDILNPMIQQYSNTGGFFNPTKRKAKQLSKVAMPFELVVASEEASVMLSLLEGMQSLFDSGESGSLETIMNGVASTGEGSSTSISASIKNAASSFKTFNSIQSNSAFASALEGWKNIFSEWGKEDETDEDKDEMLELLQSALVQAEAENAHKAFATFLVGMTDDTLRSFASIFADEDAMSETFTGENKVLADNLFEYADDTTSNSKEKSAEGSESGSE